MESLLLLGHQGPWPDATFFELRNSIVACADAESLTALLRKRGLAIELNLEEASLLRDCALMESSDPCDPSALPKLLGTASTAMPASDNPSRQNSDSALPVCDFKEALTMEGVAKMLGAERTIFFNDLEFGELLSRGEHTTVQKARYRGSGVVVKALHHQAIMYNQAQPVTKQISNLSLCEPMRFDLTRSFLFFPSQFGDIWICQSHVASKIHILVPALVPSFSRFVWVSPTVSHHESRNPTGCSGRLAGRDPEDPLSAESSTPCPFGWCLLGGVSSYRLGDGVGSWWKFASRSPCKTSGLHEGTALSDIHGVPGRCSLFAFVATASSPLGLEVHEPGVRFRVSTCKDLLLGCSTFAVVRPACFYLLYLFYPFLLPASSHFRSQ